MEFMFLLILNVVIFEDYIDFCKVWVNNNCYKEILKCLQIIIQQESLTTFQRNSYNPPLLYKYVETLTNL
jgi:hypothetical protein